MLWIRVPNNRVRAEFEPSMGDNLSRNLLVDAIEPVWDLLCTEAINGNHSASQEFRQKLNWVWLCVNQTIGSLHMESNRAVCRNKFRCVMNTYKAWIIIEITFMEQIKYYIEERQCAEWCTFHGHVNIFKVQSSIKRKSLNTPHSSRSRKEREGREWKERWREKHKTAFIIDIVVFCEESLVALYQKRHQSYIEPLQIERTK